MNKYSVYIDLDSFNYYVEAPDEQTASDLACKAMEKYIAKYGSDIGIADVVVDLDPLLEESDIELTAREITK